MLYVNVYDMYAWLLDGEFIRTLTTKDVRKDWENHFAKNYIHPILEVNHHCHS